MSAKTTAVLLAEINARLPTNGVGLISAADLRAVLTDIINSYPNAADASPIPMAGPLTATSVELTAAPTSLPAASGVTWNNGGVICIS